MWCLRRFYEGIKGFIEPFEKPQRSMKIKSCANFYFKIISEMHGSGRDNIDSYLTVITQKNHSRYIAVIIN